MSDTAPVDNLASLLQATTADDTINQRLNRLEAQPPVSSALTSELDALVANALAAVEPRTSDASLPTCVESYDILIPTYNAYDQLAACLESVGRHTAPQHTVYLLDDASPDPRIQPLLEQFCQRHAQFRIVRAPSNRGFVANVNRGFRLSEHDVILLNSDTLVTAGWLDRLDRCRRSHPLVGVVSPLSNNATILSVPELNRENLLPNGISVGEMSNLVATCSSRIYPRIPTAVGFCMLITRQALAATGEFDSIFGKGYGEETDFCMRAWRAGFEVVCCDDAYVYHAGQASFGKTGSMNAHRQHNQAVFDHRWALYWLAIYSYCLNNPLRVLQERLVQALRDRMTQPGAARRPRILHLIHNFGARAGTEQTTELLARCLNAEYAATVAFPAQLAQPVFSDQLTMELSSELRVLSLIAQPDRENAAMIRNFNLKLTDELQERRFTRILAGGDIDLVHFQHLGGWKSLLLPLIAKGLGKRVVVELHDYFLLCPNYNLITPDQKRCGKTHANPRDLDCHKCLQQSASTQTEAMDWASYLDRRLALTRQVATAADALVVGSEYVKSLVLAALGEALEPKIHVIPRGAVHLQPRPRSEQGAVLRVGFLGSLTLHKGAEVLFETAKLLRNQPVRFEVFGSALPTDAERAKELGMRFHGEYRTEELPRLLQRVDLVLIGSIWDETYCITLSEAQSLGIPVIASAVGAIQERIDEGRTGFLFQPGDAEGLARKLVTLARSPAALEKVRVGLTTVKVPTTDDFVESFRQLYAELLSQPEPQPALLSAAAQLATPALPAWVDWLRSAQNQPVAMASIASNAQVDIVVPIFGQAGLVRRCVESTLKTEPNAHLILVDDCSPGREIERLFQEWHDHPRLTLTRTPTNLGFVGATRRGADLGQAPYILFLNSDTQAIEPGWLERMLPADENTAIVGAQLLYPADLPGPLAGTIQHCGVARNFAGVPYHPFLGRPADSPEVNRRLEVNAVTGACLLIRRSVWDELGGWDAQFGKGVYEDVDLCWRARRKGYRVLYQPAARLYHYESASKSDDGQHSLNAHTSVNRTRLLAKWPHLPGDEQVFFGDKAVRRWERARKHIERAHAALGQHNSQPALAAMRKAMETAPDLPEALIGYADLLAQRGDHAGAAVHLASALEIAPALWDIRLRLADEWAAANQPARAALELATLKSVFPAAPEINQREDALRAAVHTICESPAAPGPARAERMVLALLNSDNLLLTLRAHLDKLDGEVVKLLRERSAQVQNAGEAEAAAALNQLAAYVQQLAEAATQPAQTRAHETLQLLLCADDVVAALERYADRLDGEVLALVELNERTARTDGELELADGLQGLSQYIATRLAAVPEPA